MTTRLLLPFVIAVALLHRNTDAQPVAPAPASARASAAAPPGAPTAKAASLPAPDARETAVALNYCRAAFHRIRKEPTKSVLAQEQEKILNNINLDGIADHEVIVLYSSVLDEINQIGVADYERKLSRQYHSTTIQQDGVRHS